MDEAAIVFDFASWANRDSIEVLEEALEEFKAGKFTGLLFAFRLDEKHHGVGATGYYKDHPQDVVDIAGQIFKYYSDKLNVIVKK
jgi:hypothetical protein